MGDSAVVAGPILSPRILVESDGVSSTRRSEEDHLGTIAKLLFESEDSLVERSERSRSRTIRWICVNPSVATTAPH